LGLPSGLHRNGESAKYSGPTDLNEKLKIQILRDEQIMRHMITKLDKYAVEYNHVKRNGGFAVKQKMEA